MQVRDETRKKQHDKLQESRRRKRVIDEIAILVHSCKLPFLLDVYGEKLQFTIL
jgi:hypothetical protein